MGSGAGPPPSPPGRPDYPAVVGPSDDATATGLQVPVQLLRTQALRMISMHGCASSHPPAISQLTTENRRLFLEPLGRLGPVSTVRCRTYTPGLSTCWSGTALLGINPGRPGFEVGFPLRCFQGLSRPHIATRRCRWRDNRCTRGASIPVLSY